MQNMHNSEEEEIREVVETINKCIDGRTLILVEGVTDIRVLREAGVNAEIYTLYEFYKFVETLTKNQALRVIAMLDLDREGESILRKLKEKYSNIVKFDESLRKKLRMTSRYKRGLRTIYQLFSATGMGSENV
jgi:5S rRNA maturation endonuclease (ribonuclease M5)